MPGTLRLPTCSRHQWGVALGGCHPPASPGSWAGMQAWSQQMISTFSSPQHLPEHGDLPLGWDGEGTPK